MATGGIDTSLEIANTTIPVTAAGCCLDTGGNTRKLRIVHISDTHREHDKYLQYIPDGDILIHSGDFTQLHLSQFIFRSSDHTEVVQGVKKFFSKLPHKHKIFVAGNHETNFSQYPVTDTQQEMLPDGIYLQDSSVVIEGVKIYGTPWNGIRSESNARAFAVPYEELPKYWEIIPDDVDILVTHQPAGQLLDFGILRKGPRKEYFCEHCDTNHGKGFFHIGCKDLRDQILDRIRPKVHCFGHVHEDYGVLKKEGMVFSNAAMKLKDDQLPNVIDYYYQTENPVTALTPVNYKTETHTTYQSYCAIM